MAPLLAVENLRTIFQTDEGELAAVDDLSFDLAEGEILGIVGESGSGKSATALSILRLVPPKPACRLEGAIRFGGDDLLAYSKRQMEHVRGARISMIFQEPMTSLNPVFTIGRQLSEPLIRHEKLSRRAAWTRSEELLGKVGIPAPAERLRAFPHELSGGMRQRVMIAMAIATSPQLLIADEPTTALDATVQAQILDLLRDLQQELGLAIILITHDLGVVADLADRVLVMYAGRGVELARTDTLFDHPDHPYTAGLLESVPELDAPAVRRLPTIPGVVPSPFDLPPGCRFAPRCTHRRDACDRADPPLTLLEGGAHATACIRSFGYHDPAAKP